jgi:pimeloyl-ACP methyl ester carboxylesterase
MKPQVLFIHGMWSRPWVWTQWREQFEAAGYSCTAIALPGHAEGEADSALENKGLADYVDAVMRTAVQFERPILIGHSMGGWIAQQVASRMSLSAAVLVNSAAPAPIFPLRPVTLPGTFRTFATWALWRKAFRLSRWEADYLIFTALPEEEKAACFAGLIAESGRVAYQLGFGSLNLAGSNRVNRDKIACPMLALSGARDRLVPVGASRRMSAWYGERLDYREYPEHAHWMLGEPGWQARAAETLAWLEGLGVKQSAPKVMPLS